jgi:hypothetical protein
VKRVVRCAGVLLLLCGCDAAEDVSVQPLPSLQRPSAERRAGLPEVRGVWRFAGWEIPPRDTAAARAGLVPPGEIHVATQRLDSVAGSYIREGGQFPFVGEVRRDSIFSVVMFDAQGVGSLLAGRVRRDTLWIELTSLPSAQGWPAGTRAAFVRRPVGAPFTRFPGLALPRPDTARPDSLAADSARPGAAPPPATPAPQPTGTPTTGTAPAAGIPAPAPRQPAPVQQRPPVQRTPAQPAPAQRPPVRRPPPDTQARDTQPRLPVLPPDPEPDTTSRPPHGTGVALRDGGERRGETTSGGGERS